MLSVELGHLADILDSAKQSKNVSTSARQWSLSIRDAIWNSTVSLSRYNGVIDPIQHVSDPL